LSFSYFHLKIELIVSIQDESIQKFARLITWPGIVD